MSINRSMTFSSEHFILSELEKGDKWKFTLPINGCMSCIFLTKEQITELIDILNEAQTYINAYPQE